MLSHSRSVERTQRWLQWTLLINGTERGDLQGAPFSIDIAGASASTLSKRELAVTAQPVRRGNVIGEAFPRGADTGDEARIVSEELQQVVNVTLQVRSSSRWHRHGYARAQSGATAPDLDANTAYSCSDSRTACRCMGARAQHRLYNYTKARWWSACTYLPPRGRRATT